MTDKDRGVGRTYVGTAPFGDHTEFASIDQVAGMTDGNGALGVAEMIAEVVTDETGLCTTEVAVAAPVTLLAGTAVVFTAMAVDGVEYEVFVRERAN